MGVIRIALILLLAVQAFGAAPKLSLLNPFFIIPPPPAASGCSYLVSEDFESGSQPAGWSDGGANVKYAWTPQLQGTNSVQATNGGYFLSPSFGPQVTVNIFYAINFSLTNGAADTIFSLRDAADTQALVLLEWRANGQIRLETDGGNQNSGDIYKPDPGTNYFWIVFTQGSGVNEQATLYATNSPVKPSSPVGTIVNGTATQTADHFRLISAVGQAEVYDYVRVCASTIGSNP